MTAGGLVISTSPAAANGQGVWLCGQDNTWAGYSYSSQAVTYGGSSNSCGTKSVRAYVGYQGRYGWTSWSTGSNAAVVGSGGATIWHGQHKVSNCGWFYDCGPNQT